MSARDVAARVLLRVIQDDAYAAAALSSELDKSGLEPRDRGLATEITYGVLRTDKYLLRRLSSFGKIKVSDHQLVVHLLVASYQIEFLDRVPAHAAVSVAVERIGEVRDRQVAGFANAILRRLASADAGPASSVVRAFVESSPSWLRKRLVRAVGEEDALSLLAPMGAPAPVLRVTTETPDDDFVRWLEQECSPLGAPHAYRYTGRGDPRRRAEYLQGKFVVQELGAQLVVHGLGSIEGMNVLDVCAGRGQKTAQLAQLVEPRGAVVATDLHDQKVQTLRERMSALGHRNVTAKTWDWTQPPGAELRGAFDCVLVDAPCTGVGTLRRRPEIARRLAAADPARLADLQRTILENAVLALRPGGSVLFATCSVLDEEGPEVAAHLLRADGMGSPKLSPWVPATCVDDLLFPGSTPKTSSFRLLPRKHGTDGYFVARLRLEAN
jgi:16S rRNA (cytosine967-C5)-methyltransferase